MDAPPRSDRDVEFWRELETLRVRNAQYSLILEGIQDHAVSMLDPDGAILTWNATAERIKGYALNEVRGQHFRLLFTAEDREAGVPEAELRTASATGKYSGEGYRLRKDGTLFVASVSLSALRDEDGTLKGFVKVTHDITERVRSQRSVATLSEASGALTASLDEPAMVAHFTRSLLRSFADTALVDFVDEKGNVRRGYLAHTNPQTEAVLRAGLAHVRPALATHPISSVMSGVARIVHDPPSLLQNPGINEADRATFSAMRLKSVLILPLVARGVVLGVLVVGSASRPFDERDLSLGESLARRLSLALDNARLFELTRAGEQRLHVALEAGNMGAWEWDIAAERVSWSPTLEDIHGIPRGSFAGTFEAYQSDMHPEDRERALGIVSRALETGLPYRVEYRIVRPDGQVRWLDASATVVCDDRKRPVRFVGVCTDVTERKLAERMLALVAEASTVLSGTLDHKNAISRLVELAVPAIADWATVDMLEPTGEVRRVALMHLDSGVRELGREISRHTLAATDVLNPPNRVIQTGRSELETDVTDAFLERNYADPALRQQIRGLGLKSLMCVPLRVRGAVVGAITFTSAASGRRFGQTDLTFAEDLARRAGLALDNARLYESEQNARKAADAANRTKDEFLATVSHELRTPLNAMLGWTRLVRTGALSEEKQRHALETIERNAVNQAQLIEDLLDVSRIISGKLRLEVDAVDLSALVAHSAEALRLAYETKGIVVRLALDGNAGQMLGDASRLQQVAWNLLSNAIKFTPKGGTIDVESSRVGSQLRLVVRDSGAGILPEFLPHVFERFKQADAATTRAHGGLGLGLAIARHIVELHGGTISATSAGVGQGATFTVILPASPALAAAPSSSAAARVPTPNAALAGVRILVVDDDPDGRELLQVVLERSAAIVSTAGSANEALELLQGQPFDVLLSDIGMPGRDGYDLIRAVRELPAPAKAQIPAAALTAYARAEDRRKSREAGFMMHVTKPIEAEELIAVVSSLRRFGSGE